MNVFSYIEKNYEHFTEKEKRIANYILKIKNICILEMSAKEIGEETDTSAPTVVRFAKKLGYNSLNELKLNISLSLKTEEEKEDFKYLNGDLNIKNIIYGIKESVNNTIEETVGLINEKELEQAVEMLNKANNIYIFSVGVSSLVGMDFYYKLSRINKRCIVHSDTHLQLTSSILMNENDVAFAISYSGETKEVLSCVKNAKKSNCKVIALTKASVDNKLGELADIYLKIPAVEKSLREGAIGSRISQLSIIDMIFLGMVREDIEGTEKKLIETRKAISDFENF